MSVNSGDRVCGIRRVERGQSTVPEGIRGEGVRGTRKFERGVVPGTRRFERGGVHCTRGVEGEGIRGTRKVERGWGRLYQKG
jgi:hypothetical protein